jgi:hypothetical protein
MSRRPISAFLSEEAIAGFSTWAEHHGVDRTSLIEALGLHLAASDPGARKTDPVGRMLVESAKPIYTARRARPQK